MIFVIMTIMIILTLLQRCHRLLVTQWRSFSVESITVISSSPCEINFIIILININMIVYVKKNLQPIMLQAGKSSEDSGGEDDDNHHHDHNIDV